jgi:pyruvate dehydrogenase E2 component (dihydrolipoamide acetyltransferase)
MREFELPDVGEGIAEGELLDWLVEPGDTVREDQVLARVETDKAAVDVPSPVNGTVRELHAQPGDLVPVGAVLVTFEEVEGQAAGSATADSGSLGEAADASGPAATPEGSSTDETVADSAGDDQPPGRVFAPPSARQLARELGVDLARVDGSGPGGRITDADVRAAADGEAGDVEPASASTGAPESQADDSEPEQPDIAAAGPAEDAAESAAGSAPASAGRPPADRDQTLAVPATRQVARELEVNLDAVPAVADRDGEAFVTEAAVREYAEAQQAAQAADGAAMADAARADPPREAGGAVSTSEQERREPYRGARKTIGEAMERSKFTAPHVTHHDSVDVTALVETRETLKARAAEQGVRLTYLPFVLKAVVAALTEHPVLNTSLDEETDEIVYKQAYDIGVATATDAGLMVPVVEDVDGTGLVELAAAVNDLTAKARDRSISPEKLRGSTFSVTNFGAIGGEYATPIINYPETAVLGLGEIKKRPWVVESAPRSATETTTGQAVTGEVVPRHVLTLSLSVDHRVIDGADAARFVNTLKEYLRDPTLLLLD